RGAGSARTASGIRPAAEPHLAAGRSEFDKPALTQALQPRRPIRLCHARFECSSRNREWLRRTQSGNCQAGIFKLVPPVKPWGRQIEQAAFVLVDEPPPLLGCRPVFARNLERNAKLPSLSLDHGESFTMLRGNYGRSAAVSQ